MTILATMPPRPGYGASSSLRNSQNQTERGTKLLRTVFGGRHKLMRPRRITTADSLTRKKSATGSVTRTRTGYRGRQMDPVQGTLNVWKARLKRPTRSASGVTPNPMLSTIPEKRRFGFDIT